MCHANISRIQLQYFSFVCKWHLKRSNFLRKQQQNQKAPTDTLKDSNCLWSVRLVGADETVSHIGCICGHAHLFQMENETHQWVNPSHHSGFSHHTTASCPQPTEHSQRSVWWTLHKCKATIIYCTFIPHYICCYKSLVLHTQTFTWIHTFLMVTAKAKK